MSRAAVTRTAPVFFLVAFGGVAIGAWTGLWFSEWRDVAGPSWAGPSFDHWLGTNRIGQDVLARTAQSIATAFEVGLLVAVCAAFLGTLIGAVSGYFQGRWIDESLLWLTGCFEAIPYYLLIGAVLFALEGAPGALQLAMILCFWPAIARHARVRVLVLRQKEFIQAGRVAGLSSLQLVRWHVLPHLRDLFLIQVSLLFVAAIKTEVVLSFVGLAGSNSISFGRMLAEAGQDVLAGQYQNFLAASIALLLLVWSVNQVSDWLQIRFNPRRRFGGLAGSNSNRIEPV
jgi:peptide/nickel transport system permease protein